MDEKISVFPTFAGWHLHTERTFHLFLLFSIQFNSTIVLGNARRREKAKEEGNILRSGCCLSHSFVILR